MFTLRINHKNKTFTLIPNILSITANHEENILISSNEKISSKINELLLSGYKQLEHVDYMKYFNEL